MNRDWMDDARCRTVEPDLFYNDAPRAVALAKTVCAACPVAVCCAEWIMAEETLAGDHWGTTGGLSGAERATIARRTKRARNRAA